MRTPIPKSQFTRIMFGGRYGNATRCFGYPLGLLLDLWIDIHVWWQIPFSGFSGTTFQFFQFSYVKDRQKNIFLSSRSNTKKFKSMFFMHFKHIQEDPIYNHNIYNHILFIITFLKPRIGHSTGPSNDSYFDALSFADHREPLFVFLAQF